MTNDPQRPERGRPEDPARGGQPPMQGGQAPMQGRSEPVQGRQSSPARYEQGTQRGAHPTGAREVRPPREERPKGRSAARLGVLSGLLGLIALGGITAGLVASNAATTHHVPRVPAPRTHVPTHATTAPTATARRLIDYSGSSSGRSASFLVPTSTVSAHYTYTCPSSLASAPHGFQAQLENAAGTDIEQFAASRNMTGSGTMALHPKDVGSHYRVVTMTNCPFRVKVDSP